MPRRAPKSVKRAGMASVPVTLSLMAFLCVPHHSSSVITAAAEHYVITTSDLPRARYQVRDGRTITSPRAYS